MQTRIADLRAIQTVVLSSMSSTGIPPNVLDLYNALKEANNGQPLLDPLINKPVCYDQDPENGYGTPLFYCSYTYRLCDDGMGYAIGTRFENSSNTKLYEGDDITDNPMSLIDEKIYEIGSCTLKCNSCTISGKSHYIPLKLYGTTNGSTYDFVSSPTIDNFYAMQG